MDRTKTRTSGRTTVCSHPTAPLKRTARLSGSPAVFVPRLVGSLLVLTALLPTEIALAQQPSAVPAPTFRSQSELVQIPVLVRHRGKHVSGLTSEDFTVLENGVVQRIAGFEEVAVPDQPPERHRPETGWVTNGSWQAEGPGRITILVFDLLNTPYVKQVYLRDALMRFLGALPVRHDPIMLAAFTPKGLKIVHFFATDPAVLRAAVTKMKTQMSEVERSSELDRSKEEATEAAMAQVAAQKGGHVEADDPDVQRLKELFQTVSDQHVQTRDLHRTTLTLLMMQQLAQSLSGIPGRKSMIWATGGIVYIKGSDEPNKIAPGPHKTEGISDTQIAEGNELFDSTWRKLSDANIAVYVVDLEELTNPGYTDAAFSTSQVQSLRVTRGYGLRAQAMNGFTDKTGGSYCPLQQNLQDCFTNAMEDSGRYYMLAYYPRKGKPGWRKLKVSVATPGAKVHTRSGYYFRGVDELPEIREGEVAQALASPLEATGIPLSMRWTQPAQGGVTSPETRWFEIVIDPKAILIDSSSQNHFYMSVTAASRNAKGEYKGELAKKIEGNLHPDDLKTVLSKGLLYRDSIVVPAGEVDVRFVVRDEISGRIGSVTATLLP